MNREKFEKVRENQNKALYQLPIHSFFRGIHSPPTRAVQHEPRSIKTGLHGVALLMLMRRLTPTCISMISLRFQGTSEGKTHHPVATLFRSVSHDVEVDDTSGLIVLRLDSAREVGQIFHGVRLDQILVVQMIKEDVQAALGVVNLGLERCGCTGLNALHV